MSAISTWLLLVLSGLLLLLVCVLFIQVLCALLPRRREPRVPAMRPALAVLVPAHDEAAGIGRTLRSVRLQLTPGDRLLVVADNCSDDTAGIAAAAGAEVVERHDPIRRGKGYALDFGIRHLQVDPPALVVMVDADCELDAGAIGRIACASAATGRPVQALYLMKSPSSANTMMAIAEFAQLLKNLVRPLGNLRIGLPCQLMGTGMAFPWQLIQSMRLASGHLVEDMKMGIDCAEAGRPPLFCPEARVSSYFPVNRQGAQSQRTRWEHGHLGMIIGEAPRLLVKGILRRDIGVLTLAMDMCVPPLALLSLGVLGTCGLGGILYLVAGVRLPLLVALLALGMLAAAVLMAWARFGRQYLTLADLARAPLYVIGKVPMYLKFIARRQAEWVRSRRDGG
jgi:cellulose synthase/poly-beta-1,6-N-acetylglucosamine synthase-like glycosyltransferase